MASLLPQLYFDSGAGLTPSDGSLLFFKVVGSETPKNVYSDATASTPLSNPVVSDSKGVFPQIFLSGDYDWVLTDKNLVQINTGSVDGGIDSAFIGLVADMVSNASLIIGNIVQTSGYTVNGLGANTYEIVASATGTVDGGSFIDLTGSGLQAKGLFPEGISVGQFDAKSDGVTDDTAAWVACRDYVLGDNFNRIFTAKAGQHYLPNGVSLYGMIYINVAGNVVADLATAEIIIGSNVVQANPSRLIFANGNCTIKVEGLSRSHVEFIRFNELHLYATNETGVTTTKYNVSYSNFHFDEVVNLTMETLTVSGTTAWMNENRFYGGRVTGTLSMEGDYPMNNNAFYGFKLESMIVSITANNGSLGAHSNHWHDARLESTGGSQTFTFGQYTFNNIFWQTWSNFADTMAWDIPAQTYVINDSGNNNRIVPSMYEYIEKDQLVTIDVVNLDESHVFEVSGVNADKIAVRRNGAPILDTGLIECTDKSWFTFKGSDAQSFFVQMHPYDEDGNAITTEPATGFKSSQGTTVWNVLGYWEYSSPVTGGNYAANPIADSTVKFVRYLAKTANAAVGDEHTSVSGWVSFPQEDKRVGKNVAATPYKIDLMCNSVTATSEATALDLFKFTAAGSATGTTSTGGISAELDITLVARKSTNVDTASARVQILIAKEGTSVISVTAGTPAILSNGGTLQINGITIGTKAGATTTEAILTISIQTNQADPFDALEARARIIGSAHNYNGENYLLSVDKI